MKVFTFAENDVFIESFISFANNRKNVVNTSRIITISTIQNGSIFIETNAKKAAAVNILSASGSKKVPNSVCCF